MAQCGPALNPLKWKGTLKKANCHLCNCSGSALTSWTSSGSRNLSHVNAVKVMLGSSTEKIMERV